MKTTKISQSVLMTLLIVLITVPSEVFAIPYIDVPAGSWYESIVQQFKDQGYLHRVRSNFQPEQNAIRADFMQLIIDVQGGILEAAPRTPSFNDVPSSVWYYSYIEEAARLGWVKGDASCYGTKPCNARPMGNINRAEAAALLVRAYGFEQTGAAKHFSDNPSGKWYSEIIQTSADHCILRGDDTTDRVRPADLMNRAEMIAMVDRASNRLTYGVDCGKIQAPAPKISSITPLSDHRIVVDFSVDLNPGSVTDTLRYTLSNVSDALVTEAKLIRGNGVELGFSKALVSGKRYTLSIQNMLTGKGQTFADTASFTGYTPIVGSKSTLSIAAVNVPSGKQTIPKGALRVPLLSVDFTASCESAYVLEGITLTREGLGSKNDFDGIYAVTQGERVTRKRTIEAGNNTVSLHFTKPIAIAACSTRRIDFVADVSSTASVAGEHWLSLRSARDIESNAKAVSAAFPVKGGVYGIGAITSGTLNVEHRSVSPTEVRVGDTGVAIGRLNITANSVENHNLHTLLLKQNGSLKPGDIHNIRIRRTNGDAVSTIAKVATSDYVLLTFNPPFLVRQGDNITLEVSADIVGGAGRTIQFVLEEESDLYARGTVQGKGGYASRVILSSKTSAAFLSVDAGGFIVEVDGPSQRSYSNDQRNAVLANVLFTSGNEPANVRSMYLLVQSQTSIGAGLGSGGGSDDSIDEVIKNVKLRNPIKGRSIAGVRLTGANDVQSSSSKTYQIYRFDEFNIRGKEHWQFEVDFINNGQGAHPLTGDKFRVHICGEPTHVRSGNTTALTTNASGCDFGGVLSSKSTAYQMRIEGLTTGDRIADVRPRGSISANFHVIANAALTIAQETTGSSDTTVKGAKNVTLMRYEVHAGTTKGILVTRFSFEALAGSLQNGQNYQLWVDANGDLVVDSLLQSGASPQNTVVTFDKMAGGGFTVQPGKTVVFEVRSNIASSPPSSTLQIKFATGIGTYIEAEKVDGSTLSGIRTNGTCSSGTCDISVNTVAGKMWTIASQGNVFVTKSSTPVRARQILGGALSDTLLRLALRTDNESIDVTNIQITSSGSTATSIERLELYTEGALQPFAQATTSGCGSSTVLTTHQGSAVSTFCATMNNQQLVINTGQEVPVLVKARMKTDTNGGVSGQRIQLFVSGQTSGGIMAIQARGLASSTDLLANNGDASGQGEVIIGRGNFGANTDVSSTKHVSALSRILSITNASSDAINSAIPTGTADIGKFAFTTPVNTNSKNGTNVSELKNLIFTLNATNVGMDSSSFALVRNDNASIEHTCTVTDTTGTPVTGTVNGSLYVFCENLVSSPISTVIQGGQSATFMVRATVVNPALTGKTSTLQVSMQRIINANASSFGYNASHIEWIDKDSQASQNFFWVDQGETSISSTTYRS